MSRPSLNSKRWRQASQRNGRQGFTLIELLVGMGLLMIIMTIAGAALTSSMRVKGREMQMVEVQQNLRSALQLMTQDMRGGAFLHLWHSASCADGVCSNAERIAIVTTDGVMTMIPRQPGTNYNNAKRTFVCDARQFHKGDLAIVYSGEDAVQLVEVTGVRIDADHDEPCQGSPPAAGANHDRVRHADSEISGTWSASNHMFRAVVATYYLKESDLGASETVLYRRTGMGTPQEQTGVVAFNISELEFAYGVPVDPSSAASQLIFYPTLEEAVTALGSEFTTVPGHETKEYVGSLVQAVRVSMTGQTDGPINSDGQLGEYTLTETVGFRR